MARRRVRDTRNPFYSNKVCTVTFGTPTVESVDARTISLQLKDNYGQDLAVRGVVRAWLVSDAAGDTPVPQLHQPTVIAGGTDGYLKPGAFNQSRLITKGTLVIDAVPEKFKTTSTAAFTINGGYYTKAAATAIVFSAAHVVSASKFGVILIQVNNAGTVSTKVPLATQAYTSAALALAALPEPDSGNVALGYIAIAAKAATWTANTDDMTAASDLTTATFVDANENAATPGEFFLVSEADGDIDVVITDPKVRTHYLAVEVNGGVQVSGPIAFA